MRSVGYPGGTPGNGAKYIAPLSWCNRRVLCDANPHAEHGSSKSTGLSVVCGSRAKYAIAQGLRDIALVAMHRVHHELQSGIDDRPRLFRVESLDERRRSFEVSKQRGDRFALAVSDCGCTNAFGEMQRRVAAWGLGVRALGRGRWNLEL